MIPVKFFEPFVNWNVWTFGLGVDFEFKSLFMAFGPVGFQVNWNA